MPETQLNVSKLLKDFRDAAITHGFQVTPFGKTNNYPLLALTREATSKERPRLYLSAGIHGDEPAGPLALLSLLQSGFFDSGPAWTLCPVLNPDGLANKTRENAAGIDLNREYRNPTEGEVIAHLNFLEKRGEFDLTICLHEDWESTGFYLYELTHKKRIPLGSEIIQAVSQTDPIESSELIDGFVAENGIITPKENLEERELWPEALTLISSHTEHSCTLESPSSATLATRIRMLTTACKVACRITCDESL